ncbi:3',5'-cyclic-AMP phosphodiesterase [Cellvibrio zantedeschiae]|uniref:3',5'-cyclic-AMP phosphodiesterase n=1 Tax=Cellvibrio zantedeschiae TaxID=1237077 RepID=UPI001E416300|nr:3',5'-cyclic-AMP phosphodiesterase [Cellvibrio zantedeschiae]
MAKNGVSSKRFIQISDCHLGPLTSEALLGLNTDESLHDVLALIAEKESDFDYMVCTGDIASAGHEACYRRFVSIVRQYFSQALAWLPGNHDSADIMARVDLPQAPEARSIVLGDWLILLLDSVVPFKVHGNFEQSELDYLEQMLSANPNKHIMIMLHHQPVLVGSKWIDQYILRNADAFFALVDRFSNVKAIVWGHVHQDFNSQRKGVDLIATPSTCVQFKPLCDDFTVDTLMPGYRWFDLYDDGSLSTGVERVSGKEYVIDYKSAGY